MDRRSFIRNLVSSAVLAPLLPPVARSVETEALQEINTLISEGIPSQTFNLKGTDEVGGYVHIDVLDPEPITDNIGQKVFFPEGAKITVSRDNGKTWEDIGATAGPICDEDLEVNNV